MTGHNKNDVDPILVIPSIEPYYSPKCIQQNKTGGQESCKREKVVKKLIKFVSILHIYLVHYDE